MPALIYLSSMFLPEVSWRNPFWTEVTLGPLSEILLC